MTICTTCSNQLPDEYNVPFYSSAHSGLIGGNCPLCIAKYMGHKNGPQGEMARDLWLKYKKFLKRKRK
jgi:hypothetical protein